MLHFEGFGTANVIPPGWTQVGGFAGDWGTLTPDTLGIDVQDTPHFLVFDTALPHVSIEVGLRASSSGATIPAISTLVEGDANMLNAVACSEFTQVLAPNLTLSEITNGVFGAPLGTNTTTSTVGLPQDFRLVATTDDNTLICSFLQSTGIGNTGRPSSARTHVGIRVRNLRMEMRYLAIYRAP
jgi:hypothetical protein